MTYETLDALLDEGTKSANVISIFRNVKKAA